MKMRLCIKENGAWQMIFGVNTLPAYRNHGYAGELLKRAIADAKDQGRKGLVLTCKDRLVHYYAKLLSVLHNNGTPLPELCHKK